MKISSLTLPVFITLFSTSHAATFNIGGSTEVKISDKDGLDLTPGSIIQVGYFSTVTSAVNPSAYTPSDWDSFTPLLGISSINPGTDISIQDFGTPFNSNFNFVFALDSDTDLFNTLSDPPNGAFGRRLGLRIFDSTNVSATASDFLGFDQNIVSSSNSSWILPADGGQGILSPNLEIQDDPDNIATLSWEFGPASEFMTVAVPEPSSTIALILGSGLLFVSRRRK